VVRLSKRSPSSNAKPLAKGRLGRCIIALLAVLSVIGSGCQRGLPAITTTPSGLLTFSPGPQPTGGLAAPASTIANAKGLTPPISAAAPVPPPSAGGTLGASTGSTIAGGVVAGGPGYPQSLELESKVRSLDDANQQLTAQLAQAQQQIKLYKDRSDLMQRQLADVSGQLQTRIAASNLSATAPPPIANVPPSSTGREFGSNTSRRSGARLTSNVSRSLESDPFRELGYDVEATSDGVRLRIPSDQLFQPGSAQLTPSGTGLLDRVADIVKSSYSDRRIAIEGYTDNAPLYGGVHSTSHQLTSAQTDAVLDQWTRRNQLPAAQFVTLAHGSNHPISDNQSPTGRAANRRIEIVVQAEGAR
jgi:flagellar motor protein MotB